MTIDAKRTGTADQPHVSRRDELRQLLLECRRELLATLHDRIRSVRAEHSAHATEGVLDDEEASVVDVQEDLELALIEMRSETLGRIDQAIARLDAHLYGFCHACGKDISSSRLRALPFAVRCRDCEALAETARARARTAQGRAAPHSGSRGTSDPPAHAGGR